MADGEAVEAACPTRIEMPRKLEGVVRHDGSRVSGSSQNACL